jgi:hypothetical protein
VCFFGTIFLFANCERPQEEPFIRYKFDDLRNLKMPPVNLRVAVAPTVAPATVTPSATAAALSNDYAAVVTSGQLSANLNQASTAMETVIAGGGIRAFEYAALFNATVIRALTAQGTLPEQLQIFVNQVAANAGTRNYLPTFTYPALDGRTITETTTRQFASMQTVPITAIASTNLPYYTGSDPCFIAANDLYGSVVGGFGGSRDSQYQAVNATYLLAKATADQDVSDCVNNTGASYKALVATAKAQLDANIANLNAARVVLGDTRYFNLLVLSYVQFAHIVGIYNKLETSDLMVCSLVLDAKQAEAVFTRDTNFNLVITNFNITVAQAQNIVLRLLDSCHNQGAGG